MGKFVKLAGRSVVVAASVAVPAISGGPQDAAAGARLYATQCSACHGAERAGIPGT